MARRKAYKPTFGFRPSGDPPLTEEQVAKRKTRMQQARERYCLKLSRNFEDCLSFCTIYPRPCGHAGGLTR